MEKRNKVALLGLMVLLAMTGGVSFFFGFQLLASDFMDFSHLYRLLPAILSYSLPIYALFVVYTVSKNEKGEKRRQIAFGNGIALLSIGAVLTIVEIVYFAIGFYPMDGMLTAMFPLDVLLLSLLGSAFGTFLLLRSLKAPKGEKPSKQKKPFGKKFLSGLSCFFFGFFSLIAFYELGALLLGFGFASYDSPLFEVGLPSYVAMVLPSVFLLLREIKRLFPFSSRKAELVLVIGSSVFGLVFALLPLFLLIPFPTYVEACFHPYYPLDFMGSLRLSLYFWSIPNILAPLFFFLLPFMKVLSQEKEAK